MFPKKGNVFPGRNRRGKSGTDYAAAIAVALRGELGDTHRAIKTAMQWTGASERTVKHWLGGEKGPSGGYLLLLINKSDAVLHALLVAAGRDDVLINIGERTSDGKSDGDWGTGPQGSNRQHDGSWTRDSGRAQERSRPENALDVPVNVPVNVPISVPVSVPVNLARAFALNERQRWFLEELARGRSVRTVDIAMQWGVVEKTARRDIAGLKEAGAIEFVGSPKTGRYGLVG